MFGTRMCGQTLLFIVIANCTINDSSSALTNFPTRGLVHWANLWGSLSTDAWKGACVTIVRSTNNHLMAIFHGKLGKLVPDCHHFWFITARLMDVVVTTGDCNMCKVPAKSPPPTNQHPAFYRLDVLPVAQPTVSDHWMENRQQLITDIKKSLILPVNPLLLIHCKVSGSKQECWRNE